MVFVTSTTLDRMNIHKSMPVAELARGGTIFQFRGDMKKAFICVLTYVLNISL